MQTYVTQLIGMVLLIIGAILPIVNPLGDAPIFLALTHGCDERTRRELAGHIAFYSFFLLLGSILIGSFVLRLFDLSIPVVQVAGGAVVCAMGWKLLSDNPAKPHEIPVDAEQARHIAMGQAFYPLTMPLSVDAGAIAIAITVGANHAHTVKYALLQLLAAVLGAFIIALSLLFTYRYAEPVGRRLGPTGMTIILRLSAFITLCIGVGITWDGAKSLLEQLAAPSVLSAAPF
jgi:multiple antibiotic resistance protein